jgi:LAO/AO transport system kinase
MNLVENGGDGPEKGEFLRACRDLRRTSYVVGITGVPGAGKSTLVDSLGCWLLDQGLRVGVVCIDPSSPFGGGALLGDRVRFTNLSRRRGCFIRSMATRGHLGGVATAARDVVQVLQAAGNDIVLLETVGVGQTEVEVVGLADTVVLVTVPGLGDQIQVAKAGVMEIGHIFVVNKADHPEAEQTVQGLRSDVAGNAAGGWTPQVVPTIASRGTGVADLGALLLERQRYLLSSGEIELLHRARRLRTLDRWMEERFSSLLSEYLASNEVGSLIRRGVEQGDIDAYDAGQAVWRNLFPNQPGREIRMGQPPAALPPAGPPARAARPGGGERARHLGGQGPSTGRQPERRPPDVNRRRADAPTQPD